MQALQQGIITGLYNVGCLLGSLLAFLVSEKLGRKRSIVSSATFCHLQSHTDNSSQDCRRRSLSGRRHTAGHIESNEPDDRRQNRDGGRCRGHDRQCPNRERTFPGHVPSADARHFQWQSEISRPTNRGILLTIQSANINSGFVLSTWITFGTAYVTRSHFQWIFPIALQVVFPIYLLAIVPFLVESPRWVARHRSLDQATQVIARIWDLPADHEEVKQLRYEIEMAMEAEKSGSFWDLFKNGGQQNLRRMLLGVATLSMQQLTGIK